MRRRTNDDDDWLPTDSPAEWAKAFGVHTRTLNRWDETGIISIRRITQKRWQIRQRDLDRRDDLKNSSP